MHKGRELQFERLVLFSDAVFAIAITLLVIEIRLPHGIEDDRQLARALLALAPHYASFLISFLVIGRFWVGHHRLFGYLATHDARLLWLNLLFLLTIAFLPFPTAVLGAHIGSRVAVIFYGGWLMLAGMLQLVLARHALNTPALLARPLTAAEQRALQARWLPLGIGAAAVAGAALHWAVGLAMLLISPVVMRAAAVRLRRPP